MLDVCDLKRTGSSLAENSLSDGVTWYAPTTMNTAVYRPIESGGSSTRGNSTSVRTAACKFYAAASSSARSSRLPPTQDTDLFGEHVPRRRNQRTAEPSCASPRSRRIASFWGGASPGGTSFWFPSISTSRTVKPMLANSWADCRKKLFERALAIKSRAGSRSLTASRTSEPCCPPKALTHCTGLAMTTGFGAKRASRKGLLSDWGCPGPPWRRQQAVVRGATRRK